MSATVDTPLGPMPATLDAAAVAELWGVSTDTVYGMVRSDTCPVAPLHLGRLFRWPTLPVLRSVGLEEAA